MIKKYVYPLILLFIIGFIGDKFKLFIKNDKLHHDYNMVHKYLIGEKELYCKSKPIIWIHLNYDTYNLKDTYLNLTINSIINKCNNSFNICLINDNDLSKIFNNIVDLNYVGNPLKSKLRELLISKLLYNNGGMLIPSSFICFKDMINMYNINTSNDMMFVGEFINRSVSSDIKGFFPNTKFIGCRKKCNMMKLYIDFLEKLISNDNVDESNFINSTGSWCYNMIYKGYINLIKAQHLGVKDKSGKQIGIDRLFEDSYIELHDNAIGIYFSNEELLKRTSLGWVYKLSYKDIINSNTFFGKLLLLNIIDNCS